MEVREERSLEVTSCFDTFPEEGAGWLREGACPTPHGASLASWEHSSRWQGGEHTGRSREERAGDSAGRAAGDQWSRGCRHRRAVVGRPCVRKSLENSPASPPQEGLPREIEGAHPEACESNE